MDTPEPRIWRHEYQCVSCHQRLTEDQKFYSHGRCPRCGYKGPDAGTICDVIEVPYYLEPTGRKWYEFGAPKYRKVYA